MMEHDLLQLSDYCLEMIVVELLLSVLIDKL